MSLSTARVKKIFRKSTDKEVAEFTSVFNRTAKNFDIESELQQNIFLGQILTENGSGLKPKRESMNYSVSGLKKIFSWFRRHSAEAAKEGRHKGHKADQIHIAEHAYDSRIGNRPFPSIDGWRFRGGGYIQLTGRANYKRIARELSMTPEELEKTINTVEGALLASFAYWKQNSISKCESMDCATKIINRHTNTYKLRRNNYMKVVNA